MKCRHCNNPLKIDFLDLGETPPSNAYLSKSNLSKVKNYPLKIKTCDKCYLTQTVDYVEKQKLFTNDYAYFSSVSKSWLRHAREYVKMIIKKNKLDKKSFVVEIASNDGYLLKNFINKIPCLGIEPTKSTASASRKLGIETLEIFFSFKNAKKISSLYKKADLIIANNVYAHVPDINDFTKGIEYLLSKKGIVTIEFPHLINLIKLNQFDTVYHEHFSYLSLYTVSKIFKKHGLKIFDVEKLKTHGGSLRVYGCKKDSSLKVKKSVTDLLQNEIKFGIARKSTYKKFQKKAEKVKEEFVSFLKEAKKKGKTVYGYGAAAKGMTLINFSKVNKELLPKIFDAASSKQGKYTPGSKIPILNPSSLKTYQPDYLIIFTLNISNEISTELSFLKKNNTRFVTFIPRFKEF